MQRKTLRTAVNVEVCHIGCADNDKISGWGVLAAAVKRCHTTSCRRPGIMKALRLSLGAAKDRWFVSIFLLLQLLQVNRLFIDFSHEIKNNEIGWCICLRNLLAGAEQNGY